MKETMQSPVLYSFRRCPYAIRARFVIAYAAIQVELREVVLREKPPEMLKISPKGTVPVLQLINRQVLDESLDIMHWALSQKDPENWMNSELANDISTLIDTNDGDFKTYLDRYKYADRHPEFPQTQYREQAQQFLAELESRLNRCSYLCGNNFSLADAAIFPFIRQFSNVDPDWFASSGYTAVGSWLNRILRSSLFLSVMDKYKPWKPENQIQLFG